MPTVTLPIVGPSYEHRSKPLSSQVTRNWYPELHKEGKSPLSLLPTPGARLFSSGSGVDRGLHVFNGTLYMVAGETLYSISSSGAQTSIGTIAGSARCAFISDSFNMIIVTGGSVYSYDGSTLTPETDTDFESPQTVAFLNSQAIYDGNRGRFVVSDPGTLAAISSLNYATAESAGDDLVRVYVFNQTLYLFGELTIEQWWNSGTGKPPFDRIEGGIIQIGLGAIWSVANTDSSMYFLGNDLSIYSLVGANLAKISTIPVAHAISKYPSVADAIGFDFTFEGQNFYFLTFPSGGQTWVYSEATQSWLQMTTGADEARHFATSHAYVYGRNLIASGGSLYEWRADQYTDNGEVIRRVRRTATIDGSALDPSLIGQKLFMSRLELIMQTGMGLETGQGQDPQVMMRYSDDGGRSWSGERWVSAGELGSYTKKVEWFQLGSFFERIIEIAVTDPVDWVLFRLAADLEAGI